jgi:hypothetical protein
MPHPMLDRTRRDLHVVAELLLAGPQHRSSGTIRLRPLPGGFGTVAAPELRVDGTDLVLPAGDGGTEPRRISMSGRRVAELADLAGVLPGAPEGVYQDTTGAEPDQMLDLDAAQARLLAEWFDRGDAALRRLAPQVTPVLWPEHFDLGIAIDEVNYGVSPGDADNAEPYAYVGPWTPRTGDFWNAPFGAHRPASALTSTDVLAEFFEQGRAAAH